MAKPTILVNLKRCTGCWTCSMACKVAHDLGPDEWWQFIRTNGGSGMDEPVGKYPNLKTIWTPVYTKSCILCGDITRDGELPYCVRNCPAGALTYGILEDEESSVAKRVEELTAKGFKLYRAPKHENMRQEILYADQY